MNDPLGRAEDLAEACEDRIAAEKARNFREATRPRRALRTRELLAAVSSDTREDDDE